MSVKIVDNVASVTAGDRRAMFTLSNGNAMSIHLEGKNTVKVYETSASDRKTGWTLRATISLSASGFTGTGAAGAFGVTGALFVNNDLGIVIPGFDGTNTKILFVKMTYSGYAVGSIETVFTTTTVAFKSLGSVDVDVSATDAVHLAMIYTNASIDQHIRCYVRTTGASWLQTVDQTIVNLGNNSGEGLVTLTTLSGANTAKRVVLATDTGYFTSNDFIDTGIDLWTMTLNETTGTVSQALTKRTTFTSCPVGYPTTGKGYRCIKLFRTAVDADSYHLGICAGTTYYPPASPIQGNRSYSNSAAYHKGSWNGTSWTNYVAPVTQFFSSPTAGELGQVAASTTTVLSITMGDSATTQVGMTFNFIAALYIVATGTTAYHIGNMQALIAPQLLGNVGWHVGQWTDGGGGAGAIYSGGNRNLGVRHDTLMLGLDSKPYWWGAPPPSVPTIVTPDNGAAVTTSNPTLTATSQFTDAYWAPAEYAPEWQISTDSTFVTAVRTYNDQQIFNSSDAGKYSSNGGLQNFDGSVSVPVSVALNSAIGYAPLAANSWYIRARMRDSYGGIGAWTTATRLFTIGHPPSAVPTSPLNNQKFEYGAGSKTFTWTFSDPSSTDVQTAYQLRIRTSDAAGTIVYDSGKVTSAVNAATVTIPSGNKNQTLYWEVKLWDTDDAGGVYSTGNTYFMMVDPATAAVTAPTLNQVLSIPTLTLNATVSATGGRVVKTYQYRILQAGVIIWTSVVTYGSYGNGVALPLLLPFSILQNTSAYTIQVIVTDDSGVTSYSPAIPFTTSWTAPLSISTLSADISSYNIDGLGYVALTWTDANREAGFYCWNIYRRDDLIDPNTGATLLTGIYKLIYQDFRAAAGTYTYFDYMAPSGGYKVNYIVKQVAERSGSYFESTNTNAAVATPITDGYWLIDTTRAPTLYTTMKLSIVISDEYTDEQEESEYIVIGRGRHVDKGETLGPKGSLTTQLRNTAGGTSARQKRLALLDYQTRNVPLYLRNPFGDTFKVNISQMGVSRLAGVGASEFCDVTIPYAKVG